MEEFIDIAIGVLKKGNQYCLSQRKKNQSFADKWEFPGGKVEKGENANDALVREFQEELGIITTNWKPLITVPWHYETVSVCLHVFISEHSGGEPYGKEGQLVKWFSLEQLLNLDFPEANKGILTALQLHDYYLLTSKNETLSTNIKSIKAAMQKQALTCQLCLSEEILLAENKAEFQLVQLLLDEATANGSQVLISGSPAIIQQLKGVAGIHLSSTELKQMNINENNKQALLDKNVGFLAVSVHNQTELDLAISMAADIVLLSPIKPSTAHPQINGIGWEKFASMVCSLPIPVYALGGLCLSDLQTAKNNGARGIAGRKLV